ncbi:S8 family serine peptidase [Antarctobacter heliothermus]|uniref:Subtilase family protein n=1 Tax=Antarctobacter heliothermus TaxID=74033 RepID=A0A239E7W0_9RHOB|nr:S8 family serine peptidase [Antarctobacter heliothermus]SNS40002.1 Subtilase family protein [Antarctobacter heliothermus]
MTRYILLRDTTGNWRRSTVPLAGGIAPQDPDAPAAPVIETADLSPLELREAAGDPTLLTIQPAMPTRLIAPEPMDELRSADAVPGWGLRATGADWTPVSGAGVRVALLDTGIDAHHPVFAGVDVTARDFAGTGVVDANGHGTHVAATVLGRDLGGTRVGVARGVTDLLVGKALADNGRGRSEDFLNAVLWALGERADVIGFALAFDVSGQIEALAEEGYPTALATLAAVHAYRGNLRLCEVLLQMIGGGQAPAMLGAVGNDCLRTITPEFETGASAPASAAGVLAIGACGVDEAGLSPAPFTNAGAALVAPGVGIISAGLGGGLRSLNGTSMALAHAVGVAALWVEKMPNDDEPVTARSLAAKLIDTATRAPLGPGASCVECGHGLMQAPKGALE